MRMADPLPIGTKVHLKSTFVRDGKTGITLAPDFDAEIIQVGRLEESYTGLQSYVIKIEGPLPEGVPEYAWIDATQFDVVED